MKNYLFLLLSLYILSACNTHKQSADTIKKDGVVTDADTVPASTVIADTTGISTYGINTVDKETETLVRQKLQEMYKDDLDKNIIDTVSRKFIFFNYDLNDDSVKEIFVGLTGSYFCGSGGCSILLLNSKGELITSFSVSDYPVIVAESKTKGWKDLIISSNGKNHILKYNGKTYPSNPSVAPILKLLPGDSLPRILNNENEPYKWFAF